MTRTKKNPNPSSEDPEVQQLKKDWPSLDPYAKGDRLLPLRRRYTLAQLAPELRCSSKRLRDFEELASIRGSEREAARKRGIKKVLATLRKNRKTWLRWEKQTTGQSGWRLKIRLAKQLRNWMFQNFTPVQWEPFFQQVFNEGCCCDELKKFAPRFFAELQFDGDWQKVIDSTKPSGDPLDPKKYDSMLGYYLQWFATWYQRSMPFPAVADAVCKCVRRHLRGTAWRRFGTKVIWTIPPPWK